MMMIVFETSNGRVSRMLKSIQKYHLSLSCCVLTFICMQIVQIQNRWQFINSLVINIITKVVFAKTIRRSERSYEFQYLWGDLSLHGEVQTRLVKGENIKHNRKFVITHVCFWHLTCMLRYMILHDWSIASFVSFSFCSCSALCCA